MAIASITVSMPNMPCGPPKPRNAVVDCVCVLQRWLDDLQVRKVVAVVDMQHRAVVDRAGVVGAVAAARGQHHVQAQDAPAVIEAAVVVDAEVVALAGDDHVVVAIGAQLDRALQLERGQRGALREDAGVALLAAERPAHARQITSTSLAFRFSAAAASRWLPSGCWVET